jgi:hypothetical protein
MAATMQLLVEYASTDDTSPERLPMHNNWAGGRVGYGSAG